MKKILIAQDIHSQLRQKNNFLDRADMLVLLAKSHEEALAVYRAEHADLIITQLDLPGMSAEQFCAQIRQEAGPRTVPILLVCANDASARKRSAECKATVVITQPFKPAVLLAKAKQLLNISWRETYRVLLSISVEGSAAGQMFFCRSLDVSATGMLIETAQTFAMGGRLTCNFFLPDATRIALIGVIVREVQKGPGSVDNRYGVQFADITPEAKEALEKFIVARAPKTPSPA